MTRLARARTLPALLMCCALLLGAVAAVLGAAAGASAAGRLGDLTLGKTSGVITDKPLIPHVTTTVPCPQGQANTVRLMVIHPETGEARKVGEAPAGAYDTAPVDADIPSYFMSLSQTLRSWYPAPASLDRTYELRLNCINTLDTTLPETFFSTSIKVTGDAWALVQAQATSVDLTAAPEDHPKAGTEVTFTAMVTPAAAAGEITLTSERVGAEPVELGKKAVENGTAVFTTSTLTTGVQKITAQFTPSAPDAYAGSSAVINAYTVDEAGPDPSGSPTGSPSPSGSETPDEPADLEVVDADGNPLGENPNLEAGQKVAITASGYSANSKVKVALSDSEATFGDATADAEGIVQGYDFTVPEDIADGDHTLTLAEDKADGHSVAFAFTTGEVTDPDPTPEPSDSTGVDGGTTDGATGGDTGGADTGGTGGSDGGAGGGDGDGGSLASTGTGIAAISLGSLALLFVGAAFVVSARRKGLLTFAAPSGPAGD
ncbi:Ig-like domain-containing protein [Streptomyces odonnellii]|uniref:Ig-like domain-containing protein n=1 Tax=Streptomyces odonnellii TaxID=1417980 RepID=UPI000625318F|nr:Ig-like domain-containing protein [Streptomyces odonnellii]